MPGITLAEFLLQKFRDKFGKPLEVGEYADRNPLEVRVGGLLTLDTPEERDLFFSVRQIAHALETAGSRQVWFADYRLSAATLDGRAGDKVWRTLRVSPVEEGDQFLRFDCVLLRQFYECDYNRAAADNLYVHDFAPPERGQFVYPVLQDPAGQFRDFQSGEQFSRRFRGYAGWERPHQVDYTVLRDSDGSGRVDRDEVSTDRVCFWDYERDVPVGASGRTRKEFIYVERDADGYFRLYRGRQIPQESITKL